MTMNRKAANARAQSRALAHVTTEAARLRAEGVDPDRSVPLAVASLSEEDEAVLVGVTVETLRANKAWRRQVGVQIAAVLVDQSNPVAAGW